MNRLLRRDGRTKAGRESEPSVGSIDRQRIESTEMDSEKGFDPHKQVKGRKRDIPMQGMVQERRAEVERFSRVTPPPMLGTPPAFEMTDGGPMIRAMFKGELSPQNTSNGAANKVKGLPGSAGVVRGTARVIHSLAEAGKLQPGDVLVTESTEPPWTPLFATAAAIVTDTGGVLSHSAVVAREYRIPAVVGTGHATSTFQDGQLLEVDGNAGTVRVVVEEAEHELALAR